jgi:hypothetical protein
MVQYRAVVDTAANAVPVVIAAPPVIPPAASALYTSQYTFKLPYPPFFAPKDTFTTRKPKLAWGAKINAINEVLVTP